MSLRPAPSPRRSLAAPWIGVGLTLIGLLTATSVMGAPAVTPATGATGWLPPDGSRRAFTSAGNTHTVEWSRPTPHSLMQFNSPTFMTWAGITETDWTEAAYLRVASQRLDDQGAATTTGEDLWVVDDSGARTIAESTSDVGDTVWEPGRLDLPADLAPGTTWVSDGAVAFRPLAGEWTAADYHAEYRATAAPGTAGLPDRCVVVAMNLTINQQELPSARTWCPGAGVVASEDGESTWTQIPDPPRLTLPAHPSFDWSRAGDLEFTHLTHSQPGADNTFLSPVSAPAALPDGSLAVANRLMPDLIALDTTDDPPPVRWAARPGGTLTSAASFAGVTVVTTSRRSLVGYGPDGQWLWETSLSDLTRVSPVLADADTVVVVTLDGGVTGYDLVTGRQRWRTTLGAEIRLTPLVAGDRLLVADAGGALTCLDATGAELWAVDAGQVSAMAVSSGPDPVVAVGRADAYLVQAYALSDGGQRWRSRVLEDAHDLVALGDRFALRDDDRLIGIDAMSGTPLWSMPQRSESAIGGPGRVLLLTADEFLLLDADGRQLAAWPHRLGDIERNTSYLTTSGQTVIAAGPIGVAVGRLP